MTSKGGGHGVKQLGALLDQAIDLLDFLNVADTGRNVVAKLCNTRIDLEQNPVVHFINISCFA